MSEYNEDDRCEHGKTWTRHLFVQCKKDVHQKINGNVAS